MNLNVITYADAQNSLEAVKADSAPKKDIADESKATASGKAPQVTADDLYGRLLKYIPAPLIGIYLFLTNAVYGAASPGQQPNEVLLWILLVVFLAITTAWMLQRGVKRVAQIGVSLLAFAAFATASPGPFQLIQGWNAIYGTLAIGIVAALLIAFKPGPLPSEPE